MTTRRLSQSSQPQKPRIQAPERREDWKQLLRKAIEVAERTGDRRVEGLKRALVDNAAEKHLRRLGIIHDGDLTREFPNQKP
jgi:hypothetical protein